MKIQFEGSLKEWMALTGMGEEEEEEEEAPPKPVLVLPPPAERAAASESEEKDTPEQLPEPDGLECLRDQSRLQKEGRRTLSKQEAAAAWSRARTFCLAWAQNFGLDPKVAEQPDRAALMQEMGSSRWTVPFLLLCYDLGSLQGVVAACLHEMYAGPAFWGLVEDVSTNMVAVSGVAFFPDLQGAYDYSRHWKEKIFETNHPALREVLQESSHV